MPAERERLALPEPAQEAQEVEGLEAVSLGARTGSRGGATWTCANFEDAT